MTTFSDMLFHLGGVPVGLNIPYHKNQNVYFVDPANGNDNDPGTFELPFASITQAHTAATADQHDVVFFVSGDTADQPAAAITWSKNYVHLIGLSTALHGVGQRCRVEGTAANDLTPIITFSGKGSIVSNIQFFQFKDADTDGGAVIASGDRYHFNNVYVAGMGHATPGARAGAYSLQVSGEENLFTRCAIGLDTIIRAAANSELILASGATRNTFLKCRFLSYSETAGKFLVNVANGVDRWNEFEDCIFQNFSVNWATTLTDAFNIDASSTYQIILRGANQLVGVTGWADTVTRVYSSAPAASAGFGTQVSPTT